MSVVTAHYAFQSTAGQFKLTDSTFSTLWDGYTWKALEYEVRSGADGISGSAVAFMGGGGSSVGQVYTRDNTTSNMVTLNPNYIRYSKAGTAWGDLKWDNITGTTKVIQLPNTAGTIALLSDLFYTSDGTISGNRQVIMGDYYVHFKTGAEVMFGFGKDHVTVQTTDAGGNASPRFNIGGGVNVTEILTSNALVGISAGGAITPLSALDVYSATGYSQFRLRTQYTPSSTADTNGNTGDLCADDNYVYYKSSAGWKRATLSTF
jgi:hypothetical protein